MHAFEPQRVEHRNDLCADRFRRHGVTRRHGVGFAAAEQIWPVDAAGFRDRRDPAVPEPRVSREAVHHQDRDRLLPWPQVIVDGAVHRKAFGNRDARHWRLLTADAVSASVASSIVPAKGAPRMAEAHGIVGSGDYRYEVAADWAKLPAGWAFRDVA